MYMIDDHLNCKDLGFGLKLYISDWHVQKTYKHYVKVRFKATLTANEVPIFEKTTNAVCEKNDWSTKKVMAIYDSLTEEGFCEMHERLYYKSTFIPLFESARKEAFDLFKHTKALKCWKNWFDYFPCHPELLSYGLTYIVMDNLFRLYPQVESQVPNQVVQFLKTLCDIFDLETRTGGKIWQTNDSFIWTHHNIKTPFIMVYSDNQGWKRTDEMNLIFRRYQLLTQLCK